MYKNNCLICGSGLVYFDHPELMRCELCGRSFETTVSCENHHYICDDCHAEKGLEAIARICRKSDSKNPVALLNLIMNDPFVYMHGPEHHVMVGAALLTAFHNAGGAIGLDRALSEMERRGRQVPGGICGFWGSCGAAVSTGIAMSILTETTPLSTESWQLCNRMTAAALTEIASCRGPRCCKRNAFFAVQAAAKLIEAHFGIRLTVPEKIGCGFFGQNAECLKEDCPFYPKKKETEE